MAEKVYWIDGLKGFGNQIGGFCEDNKAHICTGLAVIGTISTGVLSARSGARSAREIDRKENELGRKLTAREKAKLCGKHFIVPVLTGIAASAGAIGSDIINTKTIARTNAALLMTEQAYEQLSRKTKEVLGDKKNRQIQDEVAKEKIEEAKKVGVISVNSFDNAPRVGSGTLFPYVDGYSLLPVWTNPDYIASQVKDLRAMMRDLAPRGDDYDYYDKEIGVPYSEWLHRIGYEGAHICGSPERKQAGWNKGFAADGCEDDEIAYYTTTMEWEPGFAVTVLNWEKNPSNMKLGRLIKSSGVGL